MRHVARASAAILLGVTALSVTSIAAADPTKKDDQYGYIFDDDVLKAPQNGAAQTNITVLRLGRRDRLLKPRVHFVTEMLKSVENM